MTRSKKLADAVSDAEAELVAREAQRLTDAALDNEQVSRFTGSLDEARDALEVLREDFSARPSNFDADALHEAEAEVQRWEFALAGAESRLKQLEKSKTVTDKTLAEAVSPVISSALPGVPTHTVIREALPAVLQKVSKVDLPVAFLVSLESPKTPRNVSGYGALGPIAGDVEVHYVRSIVHRELSRRSVIEADAGGVRLKVKTERTREDADQLIDVLRIGVDYAVPTVPSFSGEVSEFAVSQVGSRLRTVLLAGAASGCAMPTPRVSVVSVETNDRDERLVTVEVEAMAVPRDSARGKHIIRSWNSREANVGIVALPDPFAGDVTEALRRRQSDPLARLEKASANDAVESLVSSFFAGVGRVSAADLSSVRTEGEARHYNARFELVSKNGRL